MSLIKTSDKLPRLKKGERQKINEKELLRLAEKVKIILKKEFKNIYGEDISSSRNFIGD
jgi:hypothetical protein